MRLTEQEKYMLDGKNGKAVQLAMRVLCDLGAYYGAEEFVPITACHDDSTVYFGEAQVAFAEYLVELGAKFAVPTSTNACALDMARWDRQRHDAAWMAATRRIEAAHIKLGAMPSWTCAPYQTGFSPCFGAQVAYAESNVICFANSIIGARTNRYAGPLELLCGIAGRVPYFGLHRKENRYAKGLVVLGDDVKPELFEEPCMFQYAAYAYGSIVGDRVWALSGMPTRHITTDDLKQFSATAASSGGIALFHLIGITPEAQTRDMAFDGKKPEEIVSIGQKERRREMTHITGKAAARRFKLGLQTYTLHLSGLGESRGFQSEGKTFEFEKVIDLDKLMDMCVEEGIEVIHMTLVDLDNDLSDEHLAAVREKAERLGLDLELNISFNAPSDPRVNCTIEESLEIAHKLGCKLVKSIKYMHEVLDIGIRGR